MTRHRLDKQIKDEIKREKKWNDHQIKFCIWLESDTPKPNTAQIDKIFQKIMFERQRSKRCYLSCCNRLCTDRLKINYEK